MTEKISLAKELERFKRILRSTPQYKKVKFVILFGSQAEGKATPLSDIDLAVYYGGDKRERFDFRLALMGKLPDLFDVHIYQDLPLFVQKSVLRGKVIYAADLDAVYAAAYATIRDYDGYGKYLQEYLRVGKQEAER